MPHHVTSMQQDECKAKYGLPVYYRFLRCFELMPLCAIVANYHGRYFCTHGGISPGLKSLDQIATLDRRQVPVSHIFFGDSLVVSSRRVRHARLQNYINVGWEDGIFL